MLGAHLAVGSIPYGRGKAGAWEALAGARGPWLLARSGAVRSVALDRGELWRLFSAPFLHVNGLHLVANLVGLALVGRVVEAVFGRARALGLFVACAAAGSLASWLIGRTETSAGASGGLFGWMGALLAFGLGRGRLLPPDLRGSLQAQLGASVVLNLGIGLLVPMIDNLAHIGGLLAGLGLGLVTDDRVRAGPAPSAGRRRLIALLCAAALGWGALGVGARWP